MIIPSRTSYVVLFATMLLAVNMYVDRAAVGQLKNSIADDLDLTKSQAGWFIGAFFWAYALGQVPAATLGLRLGFRNVLVVFLVVWSAATVLTGLSQSFAVLIASRIALGLAEAGAYPNANALIRGWFPMHLRGRACSAVTFGGRAGWAISQFLTPLLEVAFHSWRWVLVLYGVVGILLAIPFGWLAKDREESSNEWPTVASDPMQVSLNLENTTHLSFVRMLLDRNMIASSIVQFLINFGWVFLLSDLPSYLQKELGVDKVETGFLSTIPPLVSCIGMLLGGTATDLLVRRLGLRRARSYPIAAMMFFCSVSYLACSGVTNPLLFVLTLSIMAIAVDLSNPSLWAFSQDIGGRNAGKVLGWCNMFGNFGAGLSPILLSWFQARYGWSACFYLFSSCFFVAGLVALAMNAEHKVEYKK